MGHTRITQRVWVQGVPAQHASRSCCAGGTVSARGLNTDKLNGRHATVGKTPGLQVCHAHPRRFTIFVAVEFLLN